jgi:hypothetical protein
MTRYFCAGAGVAGAVVAGAGDAGAGAAEAGAGAGAAAGAAAGGVADGAGATMAAGGVNVGAPTFIVVLPAYHVASSGTIISATMLMILISGFTAGPAVSLYGSPTVSPVTAALCASDPLPP